MTRDEVVTEARRWLHVPYRKRGRTRGGLDCLGLGIVVADAFGVAYEDPGDDYSDWPHPERRILTELQRWLKPVSPCEAWTGCVGVFAQERLPGHVGFFTMKHARAHVIHARMRLGVTEEEWRGDPMQPQAMRLVALFAFPALDV